MDVKQRLKTYLDSKGLSQLSFCKTLKVSTGYISSMRKSISPDKISSIAANYPDLNITWLLTGQGSMLNDEKLSPSPITAENPIVGDGNNKNNLSSSNDSFYQEVITKLLANIDDLRSRCNDFERHNQELEKLLKEERERNKHFPTRFVD